MSTKNKDRLSLFGVILMIAGFYVSNASSFPLVQQVLAPSYVRAKAGVERIQREGSIQRGQPEFSPLAEIMETKIAKQNKSVPRSAIVVERLEATGGGIAFGAASLRQVGGLKVFLRGQEQALQWNFLELTEAVDQNWRSRNLSWAIWLFWIGVVLTVWPLLLQMRVKKNPGGVFQGRSV